MNTPKYETDALARLLKTQKIATMSEMQQALGTNARKTVYRKLQQFRHTRSYSHNGRYYALNAVARFNEEGLWCHQTVWFSRHGSLLATIRHLVVNSERGRFAHELQDCLSVVVKQTLLKLVNAGDISREKMSGLYLYCSPDKATRKRQTSARRLAEAGPDGLSDEVNAAIIIFNSLLDEKQRRLYAGLEALKSGRGGGKVIAELLGLDPHTVAKGRKQLLDRDVETDRVRKTGAGRPTLEKKFPRSSRKSKIL